MHWVTILSYRDEGEQEEMFVGDPGHGNSGWRPLDEFDAYTGNEVDPATPGWPCIVAYGLMYVVSEK